MSIYTAEKQENRISLSCIRYVGGNLCFPTCYCSSFIRDLKAAYSKSYLGYLWAVIPGLPPLQFGCFKLTKYYPSCRETYPLTQSMY